MKCIIEHREPRLSPWCMLEYRHISTVVGRKNLWFTNVRRPSKALKRLGKVFSRPVRTLCLSNPCILDPRAPKLLKPAEARGFSHLIVGGILGDDPPQKRTQGVYPIQGVVRRNLGRAQMSTDTAVLVAKRVCEGVPFSKMQFQDTIEIALRPGESVVLPFRYVIEGGKPVLPKGLISFLKGKKTL